MSELRLRQYLRSSKSCRKGPWRRSSMSRQGGPGKDCLDPACLIGLCGKVWADMSPGRLEQLKAELAYFDDLTSVSGKLYSVPKDERKASAVGLVERVGSLACRARYLPPVNIESPSWNLLGGGFPGEPCIESLSCQTETLALSKVRGKAVNVTL